MKTKGMKEGQQKIFKLKRKVHSSSIE